MNVVEYDRLGKFVYNENKHLHSYEGNPSVIYNTGATHYHDNGKLHRKEGPAVSYPNGMQEFYYQGYKISELQHHIWNNDHIEPILPKTTEKYFIGYKNVPKEEYLKYISGDLKDSNPCF